jgi:hypothetical protein
METEMPLTIKSKCSTATRHPCYRPIPGQIQSNPEQFCARECITVQEVRRFARCNSLVVVGDEEVQHGPRLRVAECLHSADRKGSGGLVGLNRPVWVSDV